MENEYSTFQEFRCFVHKKKMTAISQYQCYCVFPNLQNEEFVLKVKAQILKFHLDVKDFIPVEDYVIDIAILPDFSCHVIELNPFGAWMSR